MPLCLMSFYKDGQRTVQKCSFFSKIFNKKIIYNKKTIFLPQNIIFNLELKKKSGMNGLKGKARLGIAPLVYMYYIDVAAYES